MAELRQIHIENGVCYHCGEPFTDTNPKTRHHSIPQMLRPKFNVTVPVHQECHKRINGLYVRMIPKKPKGKHITRLKDLENKAQGLKGALDKYKGKLDKLLNFITLEIKKETPQERLEIKKDEVKNAIQN